MNHRTLRILELLAQPVVGVILAACDESARTNKELEQITGAKPSWLKQRIELLEAYGLLRPGPQHQGAGRPAASWCLANKLELAAFEAHADDFIKALAQATERMVEDPVSVRRLRLAGPNGGE